jgi:tetratricopeptide (TPR) repeat protein
VLILVIGFGATVWFSRNAAWVKNQPTLYRLVRISRNDITTQSRFLAWDSSWKGWKDRFLVGYGWENYNIAFNKYFHAEIFMDQGSQLWFDRAHNTIFDVAVATGLIGLLVYLAVFVVAWRALLRSKIYFAATRILFIALLAHFLQNIFVFDVLASYLIMFNLFALTVFLTQIKDNHLPAANQQFAVATGGQQTRNEFYLMPMIIVLIFLIFGVYILNIKPLQANRQSVNALIASAANKEQTAVNIFKMAIDMNTYQTPELRQKLADNILVQNNTQNGLTNEQIAKNYELTIAELKKNINESPWDVQNYLYLMAILNRGVNYDARRFQEVLDWGAKASQLSPTRPQIYFEMGQAYVGMKKYNEAIEAFKKAVELNPRTMESRWNLMAVYVVAGKDSLAQEQYDFMVSRKYNFDDQENLQRLYRIFLIAGQTDKVVIVLEKIAILYPSGENYAKLAAGYAQVGEKEKARAAVTRAVELNPELATEAEKFLQILQ